MSLTILVETGMQRYSTSGHGGRFHSANSLGGGGPPAGIHGGAGQRAHQQVPSPSEGLARRRGGNVRGANNPFVLGQQPCINSFSPSSRRPSLTGWRLNIAGSLPEPGVVFTLQFACLQDKLAVIILSFAGEPEPSQAVTDAFWALKRTHFCCHTCIMDIFLFFQLMSQ